MKKLTPRLTVDNIECCLPFWTNGLGFEVTVQVPQDGQEGAVAAFAMLNRAAIELMLRTQASLDGDASPVAGRRRGSHAAVYIEVGNPSACTTTTASLTVVSASGTSESRAGFRSRCGSA